LAPHHAFVKALAVSGSTVLAGLGGPAGLVAYDTATGTATTVPLPPGMSRAEAVDSVQVVGQLVFVHVTAGGEAVYRLPSLTLVRTWGNVQSPGVTPQGMAGQVAYVAQGKVWAYHLATGSVTPLSPHLPPYQQTYLSTVQTVAIAQVPDPQAPGQTMVVGLASKGTYWTLSPQGTLLEGPVSVVASAGSINSLAVGPDGLVYGSSYLSGSTFAYNPATRSLTVYPGPGQAESMAADGSTLLLGVYPSATLWRLNPYAPWSWQNPQGAPNPVYLGSIGHQQDRPVSMVVAPDGTVYVATVPVAGELGGALAVVSASGQVVAVYRNLLPHESPISLVMSHGWVVGSTTVSGGVGAHPIASRAQLFVWDPATARLRATLTPFPGVPAIAGLAVGPHGTVYGLTHRVLFAYDPVQNRILWTQTLPWAQGGTPGYGSFSWGSDTSLVEAPDGNLYGCVDGHAFVANPYTQSIQSLYANGVVKVVVTPQDQVFLVGNGGTHLYELAFSAPSSQTP
jgi:hypothetical protein